MVQYNLKQQVGHTQTDTTGESVTKAAIDIEGNSPKIPAMSPSQTGSDTLLQDDHIHNSEPP